MPLWSLRVTAWAVLTVGLLVALIGKANADDPSLPILGGTTHVVSDGPAVSIPARLLAAHPLQPLLDWPRQCERRIEREVHDYTALVVKRERVAGQWMDAELMVAKVMHRSDEQLDGRSNANVYLKFLRPSSVAGREILFVPGQKRRQIDCSLRRPVAAIAHRSPRSPRVVGSHRQPIPNHGV